MDCHDCKHWSKFMELQRNSKQIWPCSWCDNGNLFNTDKPCCECDQLAAMTEERNALKDGPAEATLGRGEVIIAGVVNDEKNKQGLIIRRAKNPKPVNTILDDWLVGDPTGQEEGDIILWFEENPRGGATALFNELNLMLERMDLPTFEADLQPVWFTDTSPDRCGYYSAAIEVDFMVGIVVGFAYWDGEKWKKLTPYFASGYMDDRTVVAWAHLPKFQTPAPAMQYNVCKTCEAKDGHAGVLIDGECLKCRETKGSGGYAYI